jgi:uncharacterized membrane protein
MRILKVPALIFLLLVLSARLGAIEITFTNADPDWTIAVAYGALAGNDLTSTYTSAANEAVLRIRFPAARWRVTVRRTDTTWHANLQLSVMRTSTGLPAGNLIGGDAYQLVGTSDALFFYCASATAVRQIRCRFQLTGVGAAIGAQNFLTTVTYTVTEY